MTPALWAVLYVLSLAWTTSAWTPYESNGCTDIPPLIEVPETTPINTTLMQVNDISCLELHDLLNKPIEFLSLSQSGDTTWEMTLTSSLDLEKTRTSNYNLLFDCCYEGETLKLDYSRVFAVTAVNEFPPVFGKETDTISIPESTDVGDDVYEVDIQNKAMDPDFESIVKMKYNMENPDVFTFRDYYSGTIALNKALDYETTKFFTLNISAEEMDRPERKAYTTLYINVTDVDDQNPQFSHSTYTLEVDEGNYSTIRPNCFPTTPPVRAWDGDRAIDEDIYFALAEENESYTQLFSVRENGTFCVDGVVSHGTYHVNMKAMQRDKPEFRLALAAVTLTVIDVNDHAPVLSKMKYGFDVSEEAAVNSIIAVLSATDGDLGENAEFKIILEGVGSDHFKAGRALDQFVLMVAELLDREQQDFYNFTMYAQETNTTEKRRSPASSVAVYVEDANDNTPVFNVTRQVNLLEDSTQGTPLTQVKAIDLDKGGNGEVAYSILSSPSSNLFTINPITGQILLNCSNCLDYSKTQDIILIVQAKDHGKPPRAALTSIPVSIVQTEFSPPSFTQSVYNVTVPENKPPGFLTQIQALDADDRAEHLTYALADPDDTGLQGLVDVSKDGRVSAKVAFDAETNSSFVFGVTVTDGHSQDHALVHVTVTDVNEFPPLISIATSVDIPENSPVGKVVTDFHIEDADQSNDGFTVWLSDGADGKFHLNLTSNTIVTTTTFDRRVKSVYRMSLHATDYGQPPRFTSKEFQIIVTDSNTAPVFVDGINDEPVNAYAFSVDENVTVGFKVGSLHAFDPDPGSSGEVRFHIVSISPSDDFELNEKTGGITVKRNLNFEKIQSYTLTVNATDLSLRPKLADTTVKINVSDITEVPVWPTKDLRVFLTQSEVCDAVETAGSSASLTNASKDVTVLVAQNNEKIFYRLLNMTDAFRLKASSGLLVNYQKLKPGSYVLGVEACSGSVDIPVCSQATVTVVIESDSVLTFCQGFYRKSVSEHVPTNTELVSFSVNKKEESVEFSIVSGDDKESFTILNNEGILQTVQPLDRETVDRYEMIVRAKSPSEEARAQVIITVLDEPDTPPSFPAKRYWSRVPEGFASNSMPVTTVTAVDEDTNTQLVYSLVDDVTGTFEIDSTGRIYVIKALNYETMDPSWNHTLNLVVVASDGNLTANATVTVTVEDINDEHPTLSNVKTSVSVPENVTVPHMLMKVTATDADVGDRIIYFIKLLEPADTINPFVIHALTGQLEVRTPLDRERTASYKLLVSAQDAAGHQATISLEVLISDVNDNPPHCVSTDYVMNVTEGPTGLGTSITVQAQDEDEGEAARLTFDLMSGNDHAYFGIKSNGSEVVLKTVKEIPWTADNALMQVTIEVKDAGTPQLEGKCVVRVDIQDTNDHRPVFTQKHYTAIVVEDAYDDTPVFMDSPLDVHDADSGTFGKDGVVYTLVDSDSPFSIDPTTGELFVKLSGAFVAFDRETTPVYNITVLATDDRGVGLISNASVQIVIADVDDTAPRFTRNDYNFSVPEHSPFGASVGIVFARDTDTSTYVVFYTLENKHFLPFAIDFKTGKLSVVAKLDADVKSRYLLNVSASDRQHKTFVDVIVIVTEVKDDQWCPFETDDATSLNVSEHQPTYSVFGRIAGDGFVNNTYIIDDPDLKDILTVNTSADAYLLQSVMTLDSPIHFDVRVTHQGETTTTPCSTHVTLTVRRDNDFPPELCLHGVCGVKTYEFLTTEAFPADTIVGQIHSRDNDTGRDGDVSYDLSGPTPITSLFSIDTDGVLRLAVRIDLAQLEQEDSTLVSQESVITFEVKAVDGGSPPRSATATIKVKVLPDSSELPVFNNNTYIMDVDEEREAGALVGSLSAVSVLPVSYFLSPGLDDSVPFSINDTTGEIITTEKLNRETHALYQFVVIAREEVRKQFSAATQVIVTLNDVNDNPPLFPATTQPSSISVDENTFTDDVVTVKATDLDQGRNARVTYGFVGDYPNVSINSTSGQVSLVKSLDRETTPSLKLKVEATDGGQPPLSATTTLSIAIRDINDNRPTFPSPTFSKNIALKNSTDYTKQIIMLMNATDDDAGENGQVFYSISQSGQPVFQIVPLTGQIFSIFPDLRIGTYDLTVVATDFGDPPLTSTALVSIAVTSSYAQSPPTLTLTPSKVILFVGTRSGLDLNVTIDTHNAEIVKVADKHSSWPFVLRDHTVMLARDLLENTLYPLELVAFNPEGVNVTAVLEIQVLPLQFDQPEYTARIAEDRTTPYTFLDLQSVAERTSVVPVQYTLHSHTDFFEVNPLDGHVTLTQTLDREKVNIMALKVSMELTPVVIGSPSGEKEETISSSPSAEASITVYVTDANDNSPSFALTGSTLVFTLPANVKDGHTITTLKAFDADSGANRIINYSLAPGQNNAAISLDENSGALTVADAAFLKSVGHATLLALACDALDGRMCDNVTVEVSVTVSKDELRLVIPVSNSVFQENQKEIMEELSRALGYNLVFIKSRANVNDGSVDPTRTDIFFHAYTKPTNETVTRDTLSRQVEKIQDKMDGIFREYSSVTKATVQDFSDTAAIALIAVASGMFLASFVAVFIVCRLWQKQKEEQRKVESAQRARHNAGVNGKGGHAGDPDEPLELRENSHPNPYIIPQRRQQKTATTSPSAAIEEINMTEIAAMEDEEGRYTQDTARSRTENDQETRPSNGGMGGAATQVGAQGKRQNTYNVGKEDFKEARDRRDVGRAGGSGQNVYVYNPCMTHHGMDKQRTNMAGRKEHRVVDNTHKNIIIGGSGNDPRSDSVVTGNDGNVYETIFNLNREMSNYAHVPINNNHITDTTDSEKGEEDADEEIYTPGNSFVAYYYDLEEQSDLDLVQKADDSQPAGEPLNTTVNKPRQKMTTTIMRKAYVPGNEEEELVTYL